MSRTMEDINRAVRSAVNDIDPIQMQIFKQMSSAEKGRHVADMHAAMKAIATASERQLDPDADEHTIHMRAVARMLRVHELPAWVQEIFAPYLRR